MSTSPGTAPETDSECGSDKSKGKTIRITTATPQAAIRAKSIPLLLSNHVCVIHSSAWSIHVSSSSMHVAPFAADSVYSVESIP